MFGEGYVAPDGLNNSVKNYVEANGGVSWSPIGPVTLKVGYRHVSVDGKEGRPNHTLIDGAYVGAGSPSDYDQRPAIKLRCAEH